MKSSAIPYIILSAFFACGLAIMATAQSGAFQAKADVDSTTMFMGSKTTLTVNFTGPFSKGAAVVVDDPEHKDVEITPINQTSSEKDLGNGRRELSQQFTVQIFDSGLYTLPKIFCVSGTDTIIATSPVVKVDPIPLDSVNVIEENGEPVDLKIHDFTDVASVPSKLFDFMPDWIQNYFWFIVAALLLIGAFIFVYMKWLRHGRIPLMPVRKPTPPYELAVKKLNELQNQQLWQKGAEKEYYTQLTDILRSYLDGRFGINAMEMTSHQIENALADNSDIAKEYAVLVNRVLSEADFVKFAKARPLADENQRAFDDAKQFVELTKPAEPAEEESKDVSEKESDSSDSPTKANIDNDKNH